MKTVKDVSEITNVSIRTLRYYDKIGLLKPSGYTNSGYRLYAKKDIEKLQQILFFKELDIRLSDIKSLLVNPDTDKKQTLMAQKILLEKKRNRLNRLIELIDDVVEGENTMNFETFNEEDALLLWNNLKEKMSEEDFQSLAAEYNDMDDFQESFIKNATDEKKNAELIKWYGSKQKALAAGLTGQTDQSSYQKKIDLICKSIAQLKNENSKDEETQWIARLVESYKGLFHLDNARSILLDMAKSYQENKQLAEANDNIYGTGFSAYLGEAIQRYYGV